MEIGIASMKTHYYEFYKELGFDYIEACLREVAIMTDEQFDAYCALVKKLDLPVKAANGFFPADIQLVTADANLAEIAEFSERALSRAATLGIKVAVLGSSKSRTVPDGEDYGVCYARFIDALKTVAKIGKKYGVDIAVEPLQAAETNMINTVAEGIQAAKDSGCDNVYSLADFFHVFRSGETLDAIINNDGKLRHTHLARANADRCMPQTDEDAIQCAVWADALRKAGYKGGISFECTDPATDYEKTVKKAFIIAQVFKTV